MPFIAGSLFHAQLRCWEARLVSESEGAQKAFKVLEKASTSLKQVDDKSTESFKLTQGLYLYFEGEIYYQNRDYHKAIECLESSLDLMEGPLKLDTNLARCYNALGNCYYGLDRMEEEAEKAFKIRHKILGNHPDTVRSFFQLGVIQANLETYDKALDFFLKAWKMEKLLGAGNQSAVWRKIIKGVFDMHKFLKKKGAEKEKEEFRQDALAFCERFWKEEKASPQFNFTPYNKEIIDAILYLLEKRTSMFGLTDKKEKALIDKYEREALWFYDGMQGITEESFNNEFDRATDNKLLNVLLRERTAFLDKILDFCSRQDEHEKLKHKQGKMRLFKKVLVRSDFVGVETQKKLTLKTAVEELYKELGEEKSIEKFQEHLLATWQRQWEEEKGKEESSKKLVASGRIIKGILQLCKELEMKDLLKRYGQEALSFCDRLLESWRGEMNVELEAMLLKTMEKLAWWIGDLKRWNAIRDALQVRMFSNATSITVILMILSFSNAGLIFWLSFMNSYTLMT